MFTKVVCCVSLLIISFYGYWCDETEDEKLFTPTQEWQVVRKGQKLPRGLHVRINFETGITEAKLLDEETDSKEQTAMLQVPQEKEDDKILDTDAIREALKNIKSDENYEVNNIKKIEKKFRSYEELKSDLKSLNLTPKMDSEILNDLFFQYNEEIKKEQFDEHAILRILEDLDFLAHQFDNALEFVKRNGLQQIIFIHLNSSSSQIKSDSLKLLGSLVQNNAKVQIHALENGSIGILLRLLNFDSSPLVKSRAVHALSCLLRRFPLAQLRFVENGGVSVIIQSLLKDDQKIQLKLITLMNDLLTENIQALKDDQNEHQNMLISQYKKVNLEKLLLQQNWCELLNKILYSVYVTDPDDHDSIERCLISMHTVASKCWADFNRNILISLQNKYRKLAEKEYNQIEFSDNFFKNLQEMCSAILSLEPLKTEL